MSALNIHPPQTYSRLFRPWDTTKAAPSDAHRNASLNVVVKREFCPEPEEPGKPESSRMQQGYGNSSSHGASSDSDREDCAFSSSSKSSYDDSFQSSVRSHPHSAAAADHGHGHESPLAAARAHLEASALHPFGPLEQLHLGTAAAAVNPMHEPMASTSDIYYAAAAHAAAASGAPFGMDPYTLSLMEQEYARVIAEDAHLKALNARKQRPKKFKCPHCDVAFSNNGQLKGHIRIHTGERPFKCDVETCGKTFTRNEELTRHKRIHTGLRPYPCAACGKKFGRRDHLKKHMKTHMPQERSLGPALFVPMYPYLYGY